MEPASGLKLDHNHYLSLREFPYIIRWRDDRCKRCGKCTAVCPVKAIVPAVKVQRMERYCTGCGTCSLVCPNEAIEPEYNQANKFLHYKNKGGDGYKRGGRRNDPAISTLDRIKFTRISMLTDPALDAGRHEFRVRSYIGRILPPEELPLKILDGKLIVDKTS